MDVKIVAFAGTKVAVLEDRGPPERVNDTAQRFIEWRKESKLSPKDRSRSVGAAYDNPTPRKRRPSASTYAER